MRTSFINSLAALGLVISAQQANAVPTLPKDKSPSENIFSSPQQQADMGFEIENAPVSEALVKQVGEIVGIENAVVAAFRRVGGNPEIFAASETEVRILSINTRDDMISFSGSSAVDFQMTNGKTTPATLVVTQIFNCKTNEAMSVTQVTGPMSILLLQRVAASDLPKQAIEEVCAQRVTIAQEIESALKAELK